MNDKIKTSDLSVAAYVLLKGGSLAGGGIEWIRPHKALFVLTGDKGWIEEFYSSGFAKHRELVKHLKDLLESTRDRR
jgi:hypothetical protein